MGHRCSTGCIHLRRRHRLSPVGRCRGLVQYRNLPVRLLEPREVWRRFLLREWSLHTGHRVPSDWRRRGSVRCGCVFLLRWLWWAVLQQRGALLLRQRMPKGRRVRCHMRAISLLLHGQQLCVLLHLVRDTTVWCQRGLAGGNTVHWRVPLQRQCPIWDEGLSVEWCLLLRR